MTNKTQAEVRSDITNLLDQAGIVWNPSGTGILAGTFAAKAYNRTDVEQILRSAEIPFEPRRGGSFVSAYDMGQMAQKGWKAPALA